MSHPHWPLFDVAIRTPRLELRYPDDELLTELAAVVAAGIHDPAFMPFSVPWTRVPSPQLERNSLQHWWRLRAGWSPTNWSFSGVVVVDGRPIGVQDVSGDAFAVRRAVETGSWLGLRHQGKGYGKEARAAILHFVFAGLGAEVAYSAAFDDNPSSHAVSRSLGYEENGDVRFDREGVAARMVRLKLTRERWEAQRRDDIEIVGLDACLDWFGVDTAA